MNYKNGLFPNCESPPSATLFSQAVYKWSYAAHHHYEYSLKAQQEYPPVSLFAELSPSHIVDGTQAKLIRARWDETANSNPGWLRLNVGQQHSPRGVWHRENTQRESCRQQHVNGKWPRESIYILKENSLQHIKFKFCFTLDYSCTPLFDVQQ